MRRAFLALAVATPVIAAVAVAVAADRKAPAPVEEAVVELDARDQYELVREIIDARARQEPELAPALDTVRNAWKGRRYRWEVALVPTLCRSAQSCVAMPFDHLRHRGLQIVQGWLPRLELDAETHAALMRDCQRHQQCVFTFEGELDRFVLNPEDPTSIGFTDVEIESVRGATPAESWIRRPRHGGALSGNPNVVGTRTEPG